MEGPLAGRIHFRFHVDRGAGRYADHVLDRVPFLAPVSRIDHMPCRCIGWVIMVSLTNLNLTRSPYFSRIGSASPYFTSFSDQI